MPAHPEDSSAVVPAGNLRAQQRKFNRFQYEFNTKPPHEALDMHTPDQLYSPSTRPTPNRLPALEYPDRLEVRHVSANGGIRWNRTWVNVSIVCVGEYVGFEEIDDGIWNVYFGPLKLGRFNERHMKSKMRSDDSGDTRCNPCPDYFVTHVPDRSIL